MLKIHPIPFGSDQLDTVEPVRIEADFRNRTIQIWLGAAVEDAQNVCLGILDLTGQQSRLFEFPVLDRQVVLQDPQHLDPATTDLFEHLRAALEPFLRFFFERSAEQLRKETFRVGRGAVPLALTWQERDPKKHSHYLERIESSKKEEEEDNKK